ncbi:hypothetical protein DICSQDRAFT_139839 [Dichomitus squalens LYAD-421 SS1]|uniref:Uncharacterized protein n=1 Tax=Dichomitus squalens (strain LYAD-421) TaxID=732165 RepID=R7SSN8_DICSQ|nr:uncharacterized protein DICSQDRAFT_139839 [Dichomitus squalens LYAD-421 SS1]EJF58012.1 hypothetical protein DICSQDRAFT_139839 [Dichomitus squalens LYAD-421 SS1]
MQLLPTPSAAPSSKPLSSKANTRTTRPLKVHFKLPVIQKASPTVSVTNANAARASTALSANSETQSSAPVLSEARSAPTNSVAFPSSPIPCPSRKRAHSDDGYDSSSGEDEAATVEARPRTKDNALPFHRRISHIDILRRRSKSCLASSYFHSDSASPRDKPLPQILQAFPSEDVDMADQSTPQPPMKRRPVARRESMSAGNPSGRTVRKARRVVADAQFLASMHSSIALRVRTRTENNTTVTRGPDEYAAQDALLVERIWHTLIDMGYKPVPLEDASPISSSVPTSTFVAAEPTQHSLPPIARDAAREVAERAARRTQAVLSPSFTFDRAQDIAPSSGNGVLPVPQLIATLIMRHRERAATRPKRRALGDGPRPQPVSRSPLSRSATSLPPSAVSLVPTATPSFIAAPSSG